MKCVRVAASGILLSVLTACSASPVPRLPAPRPFIAYVTGVDSVAPVNIVTGRLGKPIKVGHILVAIVITPDGKTAYAVTGTLGPDYAVTTTPIRLATGTLGKPITVGRDPQAIAIIQGGTTWGGMTAYVVNGFPGTVTPI
jgi:DNA-binding beta-propeller fold protein YncE